MTKGYAIGSAGTRRARRCSPTTRTTSRSQASCELFSLSDPAVIIGLFIGGMVPYLFGAMAMEAVGRAAGSVVIEVRRQFAEIKGIMEGTAKPDYSRAVDMLTRAAIREMIVPSLLPILIPVVVGFGMNFLLGPGAGIRALGGVLIGTIVTGPLRRDLDVHGRRRLGQREEVHRGRQLRRQGLGRAQGGRRPATPSAIPTRTRAGPAINPLIKIINIVALLLVALVVSAKRLAESGVAVAGPTATRAWGRPSAPAGSAKYVTSCQITGSESGDP